MGWAGEQLRRDLGLGNGNMNDISSNHSSKTKEVKKTKDIKMPKQVTHLWKYFDDNTPQQRVPLQTVIDTLIDSGYHIDNVIPIGNYQKAGSTTILITEAIILVSENE